LEHGFSIVGSDLGAAWNNHSRSLITSMVMNTDAHIGKHTVERTGNGNVNIGNMHRGL
jgi:hypothetical protein